MSKRLQVLFEEEELQELQAAARREGMPVSEWVRRALREARKHQPERDLEAKLRAVRAGAKYAFPAGDIDEMLAEIERGYLAGNDE